MARIGVALGLLAVAGCMQSDFGEDPVDTLPEPPPGPGDPAWGDTDVTCSVDSDCAPTESCIDDVCQMRRCTDGPYQSEAPLGAQHYFFNDHEIIAIDSDPWEGAYWVDGYQPAGTEVDYAGGSWNQGAAPVLDVAGGNFLGKRPQLFATIRQGTKAVILERNGQAPLSLPLTFQPIAVAAGDFDHDSVDEAVAISNGHQVAVCNGSDGCTEYAFQSGIVAQDVAAGDIDGDGYDEPVLLMKVNGKSEIIAWNLDHETSGEPAVVGVSLDRDFLAIAAGDGDGDGRAEVYTLSDGGWAGFAGDKVEIWRLGPSSQQLAAVKVDADSRHIATADLNMNGLDELLLLHDTRTVTIYRQQGTSSLAELLSSDLGVTQNPRRIAAADFDGDSPSARRISGPELVAGEVVPSMVLYFPPYSSTFSEGLPYLFIGESESTAEGFTDTVSLRAGIEVGVGAEFPGGVLGAEVSAKMQEHVTASRTLQTEKIVGTRFSIEPDIDLHGSDYGLVLLSCACFHAYRYRLEDPAGRIGGDGGEVTVVVPVDGLTALWSSPRYNAMAEKLGDLPLVDSAPELGSVSSYPSSPERPDGTPIHPDELLFRDAPSFLVSDAGKAGWWLAVNEREINEASIMTELGVSSSVKIAGVKFGGEVAAGWGTGYSLMVGQEALFGGAVPPIPDRPDTPEDEYQENAYSFQPVVYRDTYTNSAGEEAGYYVLNFSVGK